MADKLLRVIIAGDAKGALKAFGETEAGAAGLGAKIKSMATSPAAFTAVAGAAAVGVGTALFKLGDDFHQAFSAIRVTTGETGPALDGLNESFKNLLKTRPDSMDDVAAAIAKVHQKLGDTGPALESIARQMLQVSSITKTDLAGNIDIATSALNNWNVPAERQSAVLDEMFRASQKSGVSFQAIAQGAIDSGAQLRALGFELDDSIALTGALGKAGLTVSDVMPALSKSMAVAAKEGKSAGDLFQETFDKIKNAPDDVAAAGEALKVFGAKAGPKFAEMIREGKFDYVDFMKQVQGGSDTIGKAATDTASFGGKWKVLMNSMRVTFEPIATKVFGAMTTFMDFLVTHQPVLIAFAAVIGTIVVAAFTAWAIAAATAAIATLAAAAPVLAVVAAIALLATAIYLLVTNWDQVWAAMQAGASVAVQWLRDRWDGFVGFITGIPGRIADAARGMFNGVKDAFRDAINWIIDKWNGLSLTIGGQSYDPLGDFGPTISVPSLTLDTPNIPHLAKGGLIVAGDNASGIEAVVPLERAGEFGFGAGKGGGVHIEVTVNAGMGADGNAIGRIIAGYLETAIAGGASLGPYTKAAMARA